MSPVTATIQLQELGSINIHVHQLPGRLHTPRRTAQQVIIPGRKGALITQLISSGAKELSITGTVFSNTLLVADRTAAEDTLKELAYASRVILTLDDSFNPVRQVDGYVTELSIDPIGLTILSPNSGFAMKMLVPDAVWYYLLPRQVKLSTTAQQLLIGNAVSSPVIRMMGAGVDVVNPVFKLRSITGKIVSTLTMTYTLTDNDYIEHNCATGQTVRVANGVVTEDNSISSGDLYAALEPRHCNRRMGEYVTGELSATSGTPTGECYYRVNWL